ncbi:PA2779 family protein [bacterium]|nr:PA2779 family protein [bacterium]
MTSTLLRSRYIGLALGLAFVLGCFPTGASAKMVGSLDTGSETLTARQMQESHVQTLLAQADVAQAMQKAGLDASQVSERLGQLDDQQLNKLASNLETIQAGKGGAYFLAGVAILLIFILIYMQIEAA